MLINIRKQKKALLNSTISSLKTLSDPVPSPPGGAPTQVFEQNWKLYNLTSREIDIVKLMRQGYPYKKIGEALFIAEKTVSKHVQNIFDKVGVSNKVELINKLEH